MCCPLCGAGAEDRVHFLAVCSRLTGSRQGFICELVSILSTKNSYNNVRSMIKDHQRLTHHGLFSPVDAGLLDMDDDMLDRIE